MCFGGGGISPAGPGSDDRGRERLSNGHDGLPEEGSQMRGDKGPASVPSVPAEGAAPGLRANSP